jgi:hypothetical protein
VQCEVEKIDVAFEQNLELVLSKEQGETLHLFFSLSEQAKNVLF